ncbi:MAG: hypothetical protein HDR48_03260 [Bacteroides sp.]|nr:hypothetical protein [Bacteroides sp.]MBD5419040.1 hypothetical protein [Bacteroides sp.]
MQKYVSSSATKQSTNIGVHLAALKKLPEIISKSIEAEVHPDYTKGSDGKRGGRNRINEKSLVHRFYGAIEIEGSIYRVKTTMREYSDSNRTTTAHSYEVTEIELLEAPSDGVMKNSGEPAAMTSNSSIDGAKLLKDVEKSYDPGKKLLDESRKEGLRSEDEWLSRQGEGEKSDAEISEANDLWVKVWGESFRTKRQKRMFAERERRRMRERAESLSAQLGVEIEIAEDSSRLSGSFHRHAFQGRVQASFRGEHRDNELRYVLWRSYQNMVEPGRYAGFEWETKDIAMQDSGWEGSKDRPKRKGPSPNRQSANKSRRG